MLPTKHLFFGILLLISMTANAENSPTISQNNQDRPVLILATAFAPQAMYLSLQNEIKSLGREVHYVKMPRLGTGHFDDQSLALEEYIKSEFGEDSGVKLDIVAHSSGAIAVRHYLKKTNRINQIENFVLLAAPNHGADATTLYQKYIPYICNKNPACYELTIDSDFMNILNSGEEVPSGVRFVNLMIEDDLFVANWSSMLSGAENIKVQDICPDLFLEHFSMVLSSKLIEGVKQAITGQVIDFQCTV